MKKGLTLEEAFKALNGRIKFTESEKAKHRFNNEIKQKVRESAATEVKIPKPYNKYYQVAEVDKINDGYDVGDQIEGYDIRILAYLEAKPEYEDILEEPYAVLTDNEDSPVCVIVGGRLYNVSIRDLPEIDGLEEEFGDFPKLADLARGEVYTAYFGDHESCDFLYDPTTNTLIQKYYDPEDTFKFKNIKTQADFENVVKDELGYGKITWEKKN